MSVRAKLYIALVIALGAAALLRGLMNWSLNDPVRFAVYLVLAAVASGLKVRLPRVMGTFSVLFVFLLAGIVELGLSATLMMSVVAAVVQSYWHAKTRPKLMHIAFSVAGLCLATTAGDFVYNSESFQLVRQQPALALALLASVFFLANTVPVAGVIALTEGRRFGQTWRATYSWVFPYYLLGAGLVALLGFVNRSLNWQAWLLILPVVYVIYRSYYLYLDRLENESRRAEAERRHSKEVAELLTHTMSANEALKRANDDLQQFAYAASHDLQEPLRMILIYSELLKRRHSDKLDGDAGKLLGTITAGAQRINDLVKDLLSYTNVSSPEQVEPEVAEPAEVLLQVEQLLEVRIRSLNAVITTGELLPVAVHRTHLVQLLQNLVSNSLKYHSPDRNPHIHISSAAIPDGMLQFSVSDNGVGIAPAYHDRIFGVFKRLHSRDVPGTGIGLAICRRIVTYYGGSIWVESSGTQGSTFHFCLPAPGPTAPQPLPRRNETDVRGSHKPGDPVLSVANPG